MTTRTQPPVYHFNGFVLDVGRGVLLVDGEERALRPKSFAFLRHLVENGGRLVNRDEIMQAVWPGIFVTDDSISQCIREIRRALNDEAQVLLRTVQRRGYRLDISTPKPASVVPLPQLAEATDEDRIQVLQPPPSGRPMVIVIPFENIGQDLEQGYFTDGLSNDLITDLTKFQELHVVGPRRYGLQVPGLGRLPPAVVQAAHYVVSGSVRRASGRVRITVQLTDPRTDVHLWAERFDRPLDDLFETQETVSNHIAALTASQVGREALRRSQRRPPTSLDAYDLYLQGRDLHARVTEKGTILAQEMFERAINLDPYYAPAYAWLAYTMQRGFTHLWGNLRGRPAAVHALKIARQSVQIEPGSASCLGRLAFILVLNREWDEALELGRAAVSSNPCDSDVRFCYADVLTSAGHPAEAEAELRLAMTLNPMHPPTWRASLGRALLASGRVEEALAELRLCLARMPNHLPGLRTLAAAAAIAGNVEEAREAVNGLLRNNPETTVRAASETLFFRNPDMDEGFLTGFRVGGMPEG
jgi:TolB-like protein